MSRLSLLVFVIVFTSPIVAAEPLPEQAASALRRSVEFYHGKVAVHGGYVYRYSDDLAKREGEGKVETEKVWVQPPGTPAVGMAYLEAHELLGEEYLLKAARDAAECLIQGQLRTGGWRESIEFDPKERKKFAYRVEKERERQNNHTTFDDDKTQSAMRLLMRLDQVLKFKDEKLHEASLFALDSVVKAQFPNGGWGQGYDSFPNPEDYPVKSASYPESWSRTYPGGKYWYFYTLNDNAMADMINALLIASKTYDDAKYRNAALKGGEFLILAQMPEPQPAWAQQYDWDMHPCWARKFEPASITGGESQGAIRILLRLFVETGDKKFLAPIPKALDYLERSRLPSGQMARFYELRTNKPLYFTKTYELTYDDGDLPTHYGFKLDQLRRDYESVAKLTEQQLVERRAPKASQFKTSPALESQVKAIIDSMDQRGAWVEDGQLKYYPKSDPTKRVIDSRTFIRNVGTLSRYLVAVQPRQVITSQPVSKWEKEISAFEAADQKQMPAKNGVVFVGSSSIRMWDLKKSFPDLPVLNRGFGGSQIADSVEFVERIVIPYEPRVVVFYAGDNDLNSGKSPERVAADFRAFTDQVHAKLPETKVLFIAIKPCPSRWKNADKQRAANDHIRKICDADKRLKFIDIVPKMLNTDGLPRPELFLKDMLHMNAEGYQLWVEVLRPQLEAALKPAG